MSDFPPALAEAIDRALDGPMGKIFGGFGRFSQDDIITTSETDADSFRIRVYTGVEGDVRAADSATLDEAARLTGDGWVERGGLSLYYEAIAETVAAHFPKADKK